MPFEPLYSSLFERLLANSKVSDEYSHDGKPCWEWTGYRIPRGYGRMSRRRPGKSSPQGYAAHRLMAECVVGRELDPDIETIEHRCEIPWCINYWHFSIVTRPANTADMRARWAGRPRKMFKPLVDPLLYDFDPLERALPTLKAAALEPCPF